MFRPSCNGSAIHASVVFLYYMLFISVPVHGEVQPGVCLFS
jgi:hypothetical protein